MVTFLSVQHIFQGPSGLAEDRAVTTFHLHKVTAGDPDYAAAAQQIAYFYDGFPSIIDDKPSQFMSAYWMTAGHDVKFYDMTAELHSPPVASVHLPSTDTAAAGVNELPSEVAFALSYRTGNTSGTVGTINPTSRPQERNRGRLYLGPLNVSCLNQTTGGTTPPKDSRPNIYIGPALAHAGQRLIAGLNPLDLQWCVYSKMNTTSRANPSMGAIEEFSFDDAWDSQRRRGVSATIRTKFPATP